ncbi:MAG: PAS domain-containing sensor histidine kinase, partial [Acidobacteriaceae bacterium]
MLSLYQRLILGCLLLIALVTTVSMLVRTSFVRLGALDAQVHVAETAVASLASAQAAMADEELIAARVATGTASMAEFRDQARQTQTILESAAGDVSAFDSTLHIDRLAERHARFAAHPPNNAVDLTRDLEDLQSELSRNMNEASARRHVAVSALRVQQDALRARLIDACGLA